MPTFCQVPVTDVQVGHVLVERDGRWPREVTAVRPARHDMVRLELDDGGRSVRFKWETVHIRADS